MLKVSKINKTCKINKECKTDICFLLRLAISFEPHVHCMTLYRLPVATFSSESKADIITTQCEAYELQEMPQGHAHTDAVQEEVYEVVGERTDRPSPQAAGRPRPKQETTTHNMYEEVVHH